MANVLECDIVVSKFELQLHYYVHFRTNTFGKGMNPLIPLVMGLVVPLLFFYKDGFGIKSIKADMLLNKETKTVGVFCSPS